MDHTNDDFCNCEDCCYARDGKEICSACGSIHEEDYNHEESAK